jgi:hypothetical protein
LRISASTARAAAGVPLASNTSTPASEMIATAFAVQAHVAVGLRPEQVNAGRDLGVGGRRW